MLLANIIGIIVPSKRFMHDGFVHLKIYIYNLLFLEIKIARLNNLQTDLMKMHVGLTCVSMSKI
jgi:hypothetical protein